MGFLPYRSLAALALLTGLTAVPGSVFAGQGYDNCTGFIDSLPTTLSTQGVWCLNKNLSTAITSGSAITIAANNVTVDCNDFKIGGLGAGNASNAYGIHADDRQNAAVRHCNVRGFREGIRFIGGAGHLVEDNRFDNNLENGIHITGENNLVRRNRVYDTGGRPGSSIAYGINVTADVIDNTVAGVFSATGTGAPRGIFARGASMVRDNRVRGLQGDGAQGIRAYSSGGAIEGNQVVGNAATNGTGIFGHFSGDGTTCSNNVIAGFGTAMADCIDSGGNTSL